MYIYIYIYIYIYAHIYIYVRGTYFVSEPLEIAIYN